MRPFVTKYPHKHACIACEVFNEVRPVIFTFLEVRGCQDSFVYFTKINWTMQWC